MKSMLIPVQTMKNWNTMVQSSTHLGLVAVLHLQIVMASRRKYRQILQNVKGGTVLGMPLEWIPLNPVVDGP